MTARLPSPAALLPPVIGAVCAAADRLVAESQRPDGPRGGGDKAAVDDEIERMLFAALAPIAPAGFVGEETGNLPPPPGSTLLWLVDPHDGTSEFLRGLRGSAVSVGLLRNGEPVLGVVCAALAPDRGRDLIAWAEGAPLTRNGVPVAARLAGLGLAPGRHVLLNPRAARLAAPHAALVAPARFIGMPSVAYRLARVAAGDAVATLSLHGLHAWDVAAGHALLRGAGGVLVDARGDPIRYRPDGGAGIVGRCLGGSAEAVATLRDRDWDALAHAQPDPPRLVLRWPRDPRPDRLDRAIGCLLGLLAGADERLAGALWPPRRPGDPLAATAAADAAPVAAAPSAAIELALALARSMASAGRYDAAEAALGWDAWRASGGRPGAEDPSVALARAVVIAVACAGHPSRADALARHDAEAAGASAALVRAAAGLAGLLADTIAGGGGTGGTPTVEPALDADPGSRAAQAALRRWHAAGRPRSLVPEDTSSAAADLLREDLDLAPAQRAFAWAALGAAAGAGAFPGAAILALEACRALGDDGPPRPAAYWPDDLPQLADALLAIAWKQPAGSSPRAPTRA